MRRGQPDTAARGARAVGPTRTVVESAALRIGHECGRLAEACERRATGLEDGARKADLLAKAREWRQLQHYVPRFVAVLAGLGSAPGVGRAVMLERLGRCLHMGGRPDLAVGQYRAGLEVAGQLDTARTVSELRESLYVALGEALSAAGREDEAGPARNAAREIGATLDAADAGVALADAQPRAAAGDFEITLHEELTTRYAFDLDVLVDGRRRQRSLPWTGVTQLPAGSVCPLLAPCTRTWMDESGAIRFALLLQEPDFERHAGCTVIRRAQRQVSVAGAPALVWSLIGALDGSRTVAEILASLGTAKRPLGARLLAALVATGVIDASGRPIGHFLHAVTKKGVVPAGGLEDDAVLRLATDGSYRSYPQAKPIALSVAVPERLRGFHELTRARRSRRNYLGLAIRRGDFEALLHTACGVTGAMSWSGREMKLRAYPASGALYAVEIYPIVLRVDGLARAAYHYRPQENVLERIAPIDDEAGFIGAMLPMEREMVANAAALICLVGNFPRHERKYGEGGYRMLVAESGHISANLVLAATALGFCARPFGGVFDSLLNRDLGLDEAVEQFLLGVLVGRAAENAGRR